MVGGEPLHRDHEVLELRRLTHLRDQWEIREIREILEAGRGARRPLAEGSRRPRKAVDG